MFPFSLYLSRSFIQSNISEVSQCFLTLYLSTGACLFRISKHKVFQTETILCKVSAHDILFLIYIYISCHGDGDQGHYIDTPISNRQLFVIALAPRIKCFFHAQLSMKFYLLTDMKIPIIISIFVFIRNFLA